MTGEENIPLCWEAFLVFAIASDYYEIKVRFASGTNSTKFGFKMIKIDSIGSDCSIVSWNRCQRGCN
jgi:hypothetical protein